MKPGLGYKILSFEMKSSSHCTLLRKIITITSLVLMLLCSVTLRAEAPYTAVAAGGVHACGLQADGEVSCEATSFAQRYLPEDNGLTYTAVSAGKGHTCGIVSDGNVFCWGDNEYARLDVPELALPVLAIDAGENHTCAIDATGIVSCWGLDSNERLNQIPADNVYSSVSTRNAYSCAIDAALQPYCSTSVTFLSNTQPPESLSEVIQIEAYSDEIGRKNLACAIDTSGNIDCWGNAETVPQFIDGPYSDIAIGDSLACAVAQSGLLSCQIHGSYYGHVSPLLPSSVETLDNFSAVDGGYFNQMCAMDNNGEIVCWGGRFGDEIYSGIEEIDEEVPVPAGFSISVYSTSTVELKWAYSGSSYGSSYEIFRNDEFFAATGNGASYLDLSLEDDTVYEYKMRAVSASGERSAFTSTITVDTSLFSSPGPVTGYEPPSRVNEPTGLRAEVYFENTVELFWGRAPGQVLGYEIRKNGNYLGFTDGTSYTDESVSSGDTADYDVIAVDSFGTILGYASIEVQVGPSECI